MKRRILSLVLIALLLAGCTGNPIVSTPVPSQPTTTLAPPTEPATLPKLEYTSAFCNFGERYGNIYDTKRSNMTVYNGVTYHFSPTISEEIRLEIILECDKGISLLLSQHPEHQPDLTVAIYKGSYPARVLDHVLYVGTEEFKTQSFAVGLAQLVFGHHVNYGIIFAQGLVLAEAMGYDTEEIGVLQDALTLYDNAKVYLDLNYACFCPEYTDENTMINVKAMAFHFRNWLEANDKLDLLTVYSDAKFSTYLSQFLEENGKGSYDNSDLNNTLFYYGGPALRLVWENEDATYYVNYDFKVQYQEAHFPADMLKSGYANLRKLVVEYQLQVDYIESILSKYETEDSRVDVQFTERFVSEMYTAAQYTEYFNLIEMFSAGPFMHEYSHYLLRDTEIDSWLNELICYYFGYAPVSRELSYQWEDLITQFNTISNRNPNYDVEAYLMQVLKNHLDHRLNWNDPADFNYILSAWVVATKSYSELTNPDGGGYCKYSFMTYLMDMAGQEATLEAIVNGTPMETFGKTWQELIADWEADLRAEYAWLAEYFYI